MTYPPINPEDLAIAQALFGQAIQGNEKLVTLINTYGPLLMASILFSMCQDWAVDPEDDLNYLPRRSLEESRDHALAIVQAVYAGYDLEADQGTELEDPGV